MSQSSSLAVPLYFGVSRGSVNPLGEGLVANVGVEHACPTELSSSTSRERARCSMRWLPSLSWMSRGPSWLAAGARGVVPAVERPAGAGHPQPDRHTICRQSSGCGCVDPGCPGTCRNGWRSGVGKRLTGRPVATFRVLWVMQGGSRGLGRVEALLLFIRGGNKLADALLPLLGL